MIKLGPVIKLYHHCLRFNISGHPEPTVTFYRNGQQIPEDSQYISIQWSTYNLEQPQLYSGCVLIETPSHYDNTNYTLHVENRYGNDTQTYDARFMNTPGEVTGCGVSRLN